MMSERSMQFSRMAISVILTILGLSTGIPTTTVRAQESESDRLHELFRSEWDVWMRDDPEAATYNGYPGQNDRWIDISPEAIAHRRSRARRPLEALEAIDRDRLDAEDQLNYDLFRRQVVDRIEGYRYPEEYLMLDPLWGVQQQIAQTLTLQPAGSDADYEAILARLRAASTRIDQTIETLRRGLEEGVTQPRIALRDVPSQVRSQIVDDPQDAPVLRPFQGIPESIPDDRQQELRESAVSIYQADLRPAFERLLRFVEQEYLPGARATVGMSDLPNGSSWYEYRVRHYTTTDLSARQIHQIGLDEVRRIRAEMEQVVEESGFEGTIDEFAEFLRTDPRFYFETPEELLVAYRDVCKRADPELAGLFGTLPRLPYGVRAIPAYSAPSQTTAYYQPGSPETGRPGYFFANTYKLDSRPQWEMEALSLHEAVPGHHLQIALAQELDGVPEFRKFNELTVFVEGWGLYSESLGEEMGFYTDPYAKYGQLSYEIWRAIRLVVDTGMHALGWSRQEAIDFFKANTAKPEHDIVVEIDRYIVWPGQALAYKIGERKIQELRARAESALGADFQIRAFHDVVLGQGAVPLDVLESQVDRWIDELK